MIVMSLNLIPLSTEKLKRDALNFVCTRWMVMKVQRIEICNIFFERAHPANLAVTAYLTRDYAIN